MEFVAIDVETANADMASICQIGIAQFRDGTLAEEWKTYVDPQDHFDIMNVSIHGIDEDVVAGSHAPSRRRPRRSAFGWPRKEPQTPQG